MCVCVCVLCKIFLLMYLKLLGVHRILKKERENYNHTIDIIRAIVYFGEYLRTIKTNGVSVHFNTSMIK